MRILWIILGLPFLLVAVILGWYPVLQIATPILLVVYGGWLFPSYIRASKHEKCLRRIADKEIEMGYDDLPWHYRRVTFHGAYGVESFGYLLADDRPVDATLMQL